ncbi:MAG TPA: hypothetical protein DCZ72_14825, partial [Armatimonadetes bacterium]|nr:hypothetical protein [Armatimonadota bacterium]
RTAAAARAAALGEDERVLAGDDGWLFFRRGFEYLAADDLRDQADGRDPLAAITDFQQQLAGRGIDLLLVLIPDKVEVYPERAGLEVPADGLVQPTTRRLVAELSAAGVETVDLLAAMLAAKAADPTLLYLPTDTHWTPAGLELAAATIAARVRAYPWYTAGTTAYTREPIEFGRQGDLVGMLGGAAAADFRPERLTARQVRLPDGTFYADDPASPIVVLGDSFCGIYHHEDCEHAGLSAHLAAELGQPVDLLMAHGSGPRIRGQLARRGAAAIDAKQLVVWTVAASDLWQYWAPWDPIPLP